MKTNIITHIIPLPEKQVLYDTDLESFITQTHVLCVMPSEYNERFDEAPVVSIEEAVQKGELHPLSFPINEIGVVNTKSLRPMHYWHLGGPGDEVHWYHPSIMHFCQSRYRMDFGKCFMYVVSYLAKRGIKVSFNKQETLFLIINASEDFEGEYHFKSDISSMISDFPFYRTYEASEYSDDLLFNDIVSMLKSVFSVVPSPDKLIITVKSINGQSRYNSAITKMLKDSGEFNFEIVDRNSVGG